MREISVKALRASIKEQLSDLPVAITVRGKVVAVLCTPGTQELSIYGMKCTPDPKAETPSVHLETVKCPPEMFTPSPEEIEIQTKCTPKDIPHKVKQLKAKVKETEEKFRLVYAREPNDPHKIGRQRIGV